MPINIFLKKLFINSTCCKCLLGLLFIAYSLQADATIKGHKKQSKGVENTMSVIEIRPANDHGTYWTISFSRSQRFYKLPNDANPKYLELLKTSEHDHTPVTIQRASEQSDMIISVKKAKTK